MRFHPGLLLALLPAVSSPASSSGYGINMTLQSPLVQEADAGTLITASFLIINPLAEDHTFNISLDLPEGWISIPFEEPFLTLKTHETKVAWIAIRVPPQALAGTYSIRYALQGREHPSLVAESNFSVVVLKHQELQSSLKQTLKYTIAGEPYQIELLINNTGNSEIEVEIDITDSAQLPLSFNAPALLTLQPGASKQIEISIQTPKTLTLPLQHFIAVTTQIRGEPTSAIYLSASVDIFPLAPSKIERYELLPMKTVFGYGMKNSKKQLFVEQYAKGTLDEAKKKTSISLPDFQLSAMQT